VRHRGVQVRHDAAVAELNGRPQPQHVLPRDLQTGGRYKSIVWVRAKFLFFAYGRKAEKCVPARSRRRSRANTGSRRALAANTRLPTPMPLRTAMPMPWQRACWPDVVCGGCSSKRAAVLEAVVATGSGLGRGTVVLFLHPLSGSCQQCARPGCTLSTHLIHCPPLLITSSTLSCCFYWKCRSCFTSMASASSPAPCVSLLSALGWSLSLLAFTCFSFPFSRSPS